MTRPSSGGAHALRPPGSSYGGVVLAGLLLAGCGSFRPPATTFHAPAPSAHDWDTVLARPARASVERLETGRVRVMRSDLIDFDDPRARELRDEQLFVPVYAYLVRHDGRGDYLVDAGLDRSFQRTTSGDMSGLFAFKFSAVQSPGEDVSAELLARGATLRGVFFTHLHPDHLSGAASLPRGIPYVVGNGESPTSKGPLFYEDALRGITDFEELDFGSAASMPPFGPSIDVFGDGSLWAISTPGHTVGHVSYLVVARSGPALITGDVSHTRWGFDHGVIPGKFNDGERSDSVRSLEQLRAFAARYPRVQVLLGHE